MTIETYEERRKRESQADLAGKYRAIGPAAILGALACKLRGEKKTEPAGPSATKAA